jgi:hypothetical protein
LDERLRFNESIKIQKTLFREFKLPKPFENTKDIFCLRTSRTTDAYHKITLKNLVFRLNNVPIREKVDIRLTPVKRNSLIELRFWYKNKLVDTKQINFSDFDIFQF